MLYSFQNEKQILQASWFDQVKLVTCVDTSHSTASCLFFFPFSTLFVRFDKINIDQIVNLKGKINKPQNISIER